MARIVYAFEEIPEAELPRIPLSAMRALRVLGVAISRRGWDRMPLAARRELASKGTDEVVDLDEARRMLEQCPLEEIRLVPAVPEPSREQVPPELAGALGPGRSMPLAFWQRISALDRHVLAQVARNTRLAWRAIAEISLRLRYAGAILPPGAWTGTLAHAEVKMDPRTLDMVRSHSFHDGRALVLSRVAGIRAARWASEILDFHAANPTGPVELGHGFDLDVKPGVVFWQAHVSTVDGEFSPSASMLAVVTASTALHDIIQRAGAHSAIELARLLEEPWMIADQDEEVTLGW
jgi:molybdenum cofactor biosynthesis enzyme